MASNHEPARIHFSGGPVRLRGTPRDILERLAGETAKILRQPDIRERYAGLGAEPVGNSPDEFVA